MGENIGLYGGSFDPIHNGHLIIARTVGEYLGLDRVVFLPSASPPHKQAENLIDASHRAEMVRLSIVGEPMFEFSDADLTCVGPSYTINTVTSLQQSFGDGAQINWIIGADSLANLPSWHRAEALVNACNIVTFARRTCPPVDWHQFEDVFGSSKTAQIRKNMITRPVIEISSTEIRMRLRRGLSIRYLVPECVRDYIAILGRSGVRWQP